VLWGVVVFYGAGVVGLAARVMLPDLADAERALMEMAAHLLPPVLAGLMLAAVISAILSTVSSQLLVAASAVSYDIVEEVAGRAADDRRSLRLGRITVAVVGVLGIVVALTGQRLVFWFVLLAWSGLGASFGPLVLLAVLGRGALNRHGALAGMLTGLGVTVAWKLGRDAAANPMAFKLVPLVAVAAALAVLVLGGVARATDGADRVAVAVSLAATLAAWALVPHWGLDTLYELVPAFTLAGICALLVSLYTGGGVMPKDSRT
jgi:Na+/proline symporter